jgi:hypothetical protein
MNRTYSIYGTCDSASIKVRCLHMLLIQSWSFDIDIHIGPVKTPSIIYSIYTLGPISLFFKIRIQNSDSTAQSCGTEVRQQHQRSVGALNAAGIGCRSSSNFYNSKKLRAKASASFVACSVGKQQQQQQQATTTAAKIAVRSTAN